MRIEESKEKVIENDEFRLDEEHGYCFVKTTYKGKEAWYGHMHITVDFGTGDVSFNAINIGTNQ